MTFSAALSWRTRPGWTRSHLVAAGASRTVCGARAGRLALAGDQERCEACVRINEKETT